jgi:hypothetical protein
MFLAIVITFIIVAALAYSFRTERHRGLIARHSYNNRYNDASGAREDHL